MIHVEGLHKRYGERVLFEDVSWHVKKRDRIGLSGPNGSGKTTLLRMLAGLQEPDSGSIRMASDTTIGYLPQDGIVHHGRTVYEEVVLAFQELLALKEEQHRIEDALAHATEDGEGHDKLLERYAEVTDRFKHLGGWEIDARVADVLKGLGFSLADQQRRTEEFSGGWQMRIALAKLLLARPNLLLMDEPTNHLDLPARNWLEEYLADYPGSVVLVSHDRYFLDATVKRITEVGLKTLTDYHGNYSHYAVEHTARMERLREAHRRQSEEIEKSRGLHQPVPLHGHQGEAGPEPDQAARQGRADRDPAGAQEDPLQVPRGAAPGAGGPRDEGRAQGLRGERRPAPPRPDGRARGPHRPRRPERRRQVDPHAHPGRGGPPRRGRADRGPQGGPRLLRPGPGGRPQPHPDGPRGDVLGQLRLHGPR